MSIVIRSGFDGLCAEFAQTSRLKLYVESSRDKAIAAYEWLEAKHPTVFDKDSKITPLAILAIPAFVLYATPWRFMEMAFVGYHAGRFALKMWQRQLSDTKISAIIGEALDSLKEPLKKMSFLEPYIQKIVVTCTEIEEKHFWLKDPRIISVAMSVISMVVVFNGMLRHCVTVGLIAKLAFNILQESQSGCFAHLNPKGNSQIESQAKVKIAQLFHILGVINIKLSLNIGIDQVQQAMYAAVPENIYNRIDEIGDGIQVLYKELLSKKHIAEIAELTQEAIITSAVTSNQLDSYFASLETMAQQMLMAIRDDTIDSDTVDQAASYIYGSVQLGQQ